MIINIIEELLHTIKIFSILTFASSGQHTTSESNFENDHSSQCIAMFGEVEDKDVEFNRAKLMQCKSHLNALNIIQCSHYLEFNMQKVLN